MAGYVVELVADGRAALQAVELHQPDLIILDVQLPGIDGYAVCDELKRNPVTWQIPIIMVTGRRRATRAALQGNRGRRRRLSPEAGRLSRKLEARDPRAAAHPSAGATTSSKPAEAVTLRAGARRVEAKDLVYRGPLAAPGALRGGDSASVWGSAAMRLPRCATARCCTMLARLGVDELIIRKGGPADTGRVSRDAAAYIDRRGGSYSRCGMGTAVGPIVRYPPRALGWPGLPRWAGARNPSRCARESWLWPMPFDAMTTVRPYNRVLSDDEAAERLRAGAGVYWGSYCGGSFPRLAPNDAGASIQPASIPSERRSRICSFSRVTPIHRRSFAKMSAIRGVDLELWFSAHWPSWAAKRLMKRQHRQRVARRCGRMPAALEQQVWVHRACLARKNSSEPAGRK